MYFLRKNFKLVMIIVLTTAILAVLALNIFEKEVYLELDDRCGPIMNMISHTIKDESACKMQCISQCEVKELRLKRVGFIENPIGCNNCTCFCK